MQTTHDMMDVRMLATHQNPDLDAIGACWLFMRFDKQHFSQVEYYFVNAGSEVSDEVLAAKGLHRDQVIHVDTGLGPFDHHQPDNNLRDSATLRVYHYLLTKYPDYSNNEALKRVVDFINDTDHFGSCYWPEADNDRYLFMLEEILNGLRSVRHFSDHELLEFGMVCLDGVLAATKEFVAAIDDLAHKTIEFETRWGKAMAIENQNDEVVKLAQKRGSVLVVRKDQEKGHIRIKAIPDRGFDLTPIHEAIKHIDSTGTWYMHPSKTMLLNGSRKHAGQVPTPLTLKQVVELIKSI